MAMSEAPPPPSQPPLVSSSDERGSSAATAPPDANLIPTPYGYPQAVESMGGVAAPLLAGFSLTLAVLVLQLNEGQVRWPEVALLLLAAGALAFIGSVQATFWARAYFVTPQDAEGWWSDGQSVERQAMILRERHRLHRRYGVWANRARRTYGAGIVLLMSGMTVLLVPDEALGDWPTARLAVVGMMAVATIGEVCWQAAAALVARAKMVGKRSWIVRLSERITP
jgi:hypothetical protein